MKCHRLKTGSLPVLAFLAMAGISPAASINPTYTVTDLGSSFGFTKDIRGYTTSVKAGNGGVSYAFEKFPVTYGSSPTSSEIDPRSARYFEHIVAFNKFDIIGYGDVPGRPVGTTRTDGAWFTSPEYDGKSFPNPVNDFNTSRVAVGEDAGRAVVAGPDYFNPLDPGSAGNYPGLLVDLISPLSHVRLTSGLFIDDDGRIIAAGFASGSDQLEDFLLTPPDVPLTTPEPTGLVIICIGFATLGLRRARIRRRTHRSA